MALNANQIPIYAITPKVSGISLTGATAQQIASTTNASAVFTASASGSRVYSLIGSTNDTAAVNVFLTIQPGGTGTTAYHIGQVNIPINSGMIASTLSTDLLNPAVVPGLPLDNVGKRYIELGANDKLYIGTVANMTAAKVLSVTAQGAHYQ